MNGIWKSIALLSASCAFLHAPEVWGREPEIYTYTSFQMNAKALMLELEIHPHLLQQARVLRDLDGDGQMSELEFDESKSAILQYVQQKVLITLNERGLRADSALITYRAENIAPPSGRIYVTCEYALLLKPAQLILHNEMFQELSERSRSYGTMTDGKQTADFEFRATSDKVSAPMEVKFFPTGEWQVQQRDPEAMGPAMFWGVAGCGGLVILAVVTKFRKNWKRRTRSHKRKRPSPSVSTTREHVRYEHALN